MKRAMLIFVSLVLVSTMNLKAEGIEKEVIGSWEFDVEHAPYEYQVGKAVFFNDSNEIKVKLVFEYEDVNGFALKIEGNKVSFKVEVQYEEVEVQLELKNGQLAGNAVTPEGDIPITMKKAKG
ncbi:hypothetical protein KDU71_09970 [Carboxylicivirga sediminis]|uniref:Lipocalin-like domain-containing protein n=1 Tax=Carboxylicivirga sediminis TaxID=2006564 RepID=A0A941F3S5_9BACT|nr:hypothetical protein [Carboxylicivirga sediminis]MBR8535882.1 hypothetical protein [Carboxylicivirga sediminis]